MTAASGGDCGLYLRATLCAPDAAGRDDLSNRFPTVLQPPGGPLVVMDDPRFDALLRSVGRATSRRRVIAILAGGAAGLTMPHLFRAGDHAAAAATKSRADGGPIRPAFVCRGDNTITVP